MRATLCQLMFGGRRGGFTAEGAGHAECKAIGGCKSALSAISEVKLGLAALEKGSGFLA